MMPTSLEPLTCTSCRAPVPLGDEAEVSCPSCGGRQPLPVEYHEFRTARQLSAEEAGRLDRLCAAIAAPSPLWKRVAVVIGYGVGIVTLVVLAIGALVGAVAGLIGAAKLETEGELAMVLALICAVVCGLISVPLVGELLVFLAVHGDYALAKNVAFAEETHFDVDLWVGGALYLFAILPIAIARRTQESLKSLDGIRAQLLAQPALAGGVLGCRACGAPLTVKPEAVAARCLYCEAESLVQLSKAEVARQKESTSAAQQSLSEAVRSHTATLAADRKLMWTMVLAGPFIAPVVCLGGLLLHTLAN